MTVSSPTVFPVPIAPRSPKPRLRYDFSRAFGDIETQTVAGLSYRYVHAIGRESFNSGVIALDRRDISRGATANDIIDSPFNIDPPGSIGLGWENDVHTNTGNAGAFLTSSATWKNFDLTVGGRYDAYNVRSRDSGVLAFAPPTARGNAGRFTYTASLSYKTPWGLVPYVTTAKNAAVEIGQASQVSTSLLSGAQLAFQFLPQ